jgi:hypothetical protein
LVNLFGAPFEALLWAVMARLAHWLPIVAVPKELHVAFVRDYVIDDRRGRTTTGVNACRMRGEKILAGDIPFRRVATLTA